MDEVEGSLLKLVEVPRSVPKFQAPVQHIDLHSFGDASKSGTSSATYVVIFQEAGTSQGLLGSNSRLSKKGFTMPKLELVALHMTANTLQNLHEALAGFHINRVVDWSDSSVALHWIKGNGKYKQFVKNRVGKIFSKENIAWHYISTTENPADIGGQGCATNKLGELWWKGPKWLPNYDHWPDDIKTAPSEESEAEARQVKEILAVAVMQSDEIEQILKKYSLWKALRVTAWIRRFASNCRRPKAERLKGPLITEEVEESGKLVVRCAQEANINSSQFQNDVGG